MKNLIIFSVIIFFLGCKKEETVNLNAPTATAASDITSEHFMANWNNVSDATDYELEVATDNAFSTIVDSQKNLGGSTIVDSLSGNIQYFYRVRATLNGNDPSPNSNVISVYTLPNAPVATIGTNVTNNSFTANWIGAAGITEYLLYVSTENFPADPPNNLPDYDGIEVTGVSYDVTNLNSGTIYYFVLRAKVGSRISENSNPVEIITQN